MGLVDVNVMQLGDAAMGSMVMVADSCAGVHVPQQTDPHSKEWLHILIVHVEHDMKTGM